MKIMNKKYVKATLVAVVALVGGINVFNAQKSESMSDIALANVEALAENEWGTGFNCRWNSTYIICDGNGVREGCPCGSHEW